MERLRALDDIFLDLESPEVQANIGGVSVFAGPAPGYDEFVARLESKLDTNPRYRQRLKFLPFRLGSPVWVDDRKFDIRRHLVWRTLHPPGDAEQLTDFYARIVSRHFARNHPLWQLHVVDGLTGGRWAVCWKAHHAMVDGIAATELFSLLLDPTPRPPAQTSSDWRPRGGPNSVRLVARTLTGRDGPAKPLFDLALAARHPRRAAGQAATAARAFVPIGRSLVAAHDSPLNGPIGSQRRWFTAEADLAEIKEIAHAFGGTVNDVVVTAAACGLRTWLLRHERRLDNFDARTMVPVSVRNKRGHGDAGNEISAVFIELPIAEDDATARLKSVAEQMRRHKRGHDDLAGEALLDLASYVPPPLFLLAERLSWRLGDTQRLMNTVTTNVPGPQAPLYCLGREMLQMFPYVMLAKNIRVATAIFSYNGRVYFGVTADRQAAADAHVIGQGIEEGVAELLRLARRRGRGTKSAAKRGTNGAKPGAKSAAKRGAKRATG